MKKITLNIRIFSIIGLLMITSSFYAQNLLVNGDFEATTGWTKNNGDILLNEKSANSIHPDMEGTAYINGNCRMPGVGAARFITQAVTIPSAGTYTFKFTTRVQNAVGLSGAFDNNHTTLGVATVKGEIFPFEADGITVGTTALATISTQSNTNTEISTTVAIDAAITKVQVKIGKDWNVPYIDDAYFGLPSTGINEYRIENLKVTSNNGIVTVNAQSGLDNVKIHDMTGKVIQSVSVDNLSTIQFPQIVKNGLCLILATDSQGRTAVVKHLVK